jgi:hypothetical protein
MLKHHSPNTSRLINGVKMLALFDSLDFDMQANLFKITMKKNAKDSLMELHDLNLMTKL